MGGLGVKLCLLLAWGGLVGEANVHSGAGLFRNNTKILDHCYFVDRRYSTPEFLKFVDVDYLACQHRCQNTTNCAYFGYYKASQTCYLAGEDAVFTNFLAEGGITGPRYCSQPPASCTEVPGPSFPGTNEEESKVAWPSHRVPEKLECWPKNESGGFYDSCPHITVLEDIRQGWPGLCTGTHKVIVPWGETCESYCRKKVACSVYQVMNDTGRSCFHSRLYGGSHCYTRTADDWVQTPLEAQRIMHGRVRVLKETAGVQVIGLKQAFDENYFLNVSRDAVPACRSNCYSNIACQWWQYSRSSGCWVEDPRTPVPWPMTTENWRTDTDFASTVIGGEYIQHVCPGMAGLPADFGDAPPGIATPPPLATSSPEPEPGAPAQTGPIVERAGTLQGALTIHGLYWGTLTQAQRQVFRDNCTAAISSAIGVLPSWVRDEEGVPGQVTLGSVVDGTHVGFLVDRPRGMSSNDVSRALLQQGFIDRVKGSSQRLLKEGHLGGGPTLDKVEVHSVVMETTPRPAPVMPEPAPVLPSTPPPEEPEPDSSLSWWFLALLVPVILLLCLGVCAYIYTQHRPAGKGSEGARERGHKKSPSKGRRRDDAPLLGSRTASQASSESRDRAGQSLSLSSAPPENFRDAQSVPLLENGHGLPSEVASARGRPPQGGSRATDTRASVLDAAFDIIDANHDGFITQSELQRFEQSAPAPQAQVPGMAPPILQQPASVTMRPPASQPASHALRPPSPTLQQPQPVLATSVRSMPSSPVPGLSPASTTRPLPMQPAQPPVLAAPAQAMGPRPLVPPQAAAQSVQAGRASIRGAPFTFVR